MKCSLLQKWCLLWISWIKTRSTHIHKHNNASGFGRYQIDYTYVNQQKSSHEGNLPHFHELPDRSTGGRWCIARYPGTLDKQKSKSWMKLQSGKQAVMIMKLQTGKQTMMIMNLRDPSSNPCSKPQILISLLSSSAQKSSCLFPHPLKHAPQATGETVHFIQCAQAHVHHGLQHPWGLQPLCCLDWNMVSLWNLFAKNLENYGAYVNQFHRKAHPWFCSKAQAYQYIFSSRMRLLLLTWVNVFLLQLLLWINWIHTV